MNDPLKRFIDSHSNDLDDLEPSSGIFRKIEEELAKEGNGKYLATVKSAFPGRWLVAASVILCFAGYLMFRDGNSQIVVVQQKALAGSANRVQAGKAGGQDQATKAIPLAGREVVAQRHAARVWPARRPAIDIDGIYRELGDSSSSSTRLSAILKIGRTGIVDYEMVDRLAKTLACDANSNVRLAAIGVLGQYGDDSYVGNILLRALDTQTDPNAQLGLIELLGRTESAALESRLHALTNDPNTLTAVKDHAYLVLLSQKKL
ncbi:MAG: HEAT repeat domain-containing protein [Pedobacter sp.]|nr:MAG: HEAT repeat domain-containing protein [Pedobacter sp.]